MSDFKYHRVEKGVYLRNYADGSKKYVAISYSKKVRVLFQKFDTIEDTRKCYEDYIAAHPPVLGKHHKDLTGLRFGHLVVIKLVETSPIAVWLCKCDCGNMPKEPAKSLLSGAVVSCGSTAHRLDRIAKVNTSVRKEIEKYGTVPQMLTQKRRKSNTSGYKGVTIKHLKSGAVRYIAYLNVAGQKHVGKATETAKEAYEERLEMERKYIRPILNKFIKNKEEELTKQNTGDLQKQDLIRLLYKQTKELGRIPKSTEFKKYNQAAYRFGSWGEFVQSAGLIDDKKRNTVSTKVTNEQLFRNLKREYKKNGKVPVRTKFKHGQTAVNRFGNWDTFVRAAGLEPRNSTRLKLKLSREDILKEFQKRVKELGRVPTNKEFKYYYKTVTYFGSWANFLKVAGYEDQAKKSTRVWHSNADFIKELKDTAAKLGRTPKITECKHGGQISKRFGSWAKALIAADLYVKKAT